MERLEPALTPKADRQGTRLGVNPVDQHFTADGAEALSQLNDELAPRATGHAQSRPRATAVGALGRGRAGGLNTRDGRIPIPRVLRCREGVNFGGQASGEERQLKAYKQPSDSPRAVSGGRRTGYSARIAGIHRPARLHVRARSRKDY